MDFVVKVLSYIRNAAYRKGQWDAYDRVLNLLNTIDEDPVKKGTIYGKIMDLRPKDLD